MKTLNNFIVVFFSLLLINCNTIAQTPDIEVGSFETAIIFNGEPSDVAYYVPLDYDSLISYKLVVGLHYCTFSPGDCISYRNLLIDISDSLNAIIMCPDCHNFNSFPYNVPDSSIIPKSIDSTIALYNIDEDNIYLTGGSCNGNTTIKYGLEYIYDFRGIISFNPFFPPIPTGNYDFDSDMPTCIISGTLDPYYNNAVELYDSLVAHDAWVRFISMEGVAHEFWIPEFNIEMMNGFHYIDSIASLVTSINLKNRNSFNMEVYPNPFSKSVNIEITCTEPNQNIELQLFDINGNLIRKITEFKNIEYFKKTELLINRKGTYILKCVSNQNVVYEKIISM